MNDLFAEGFESWLVKLGPSESMGECFLALEISETQRNELRILTFVQ